MVAMTSYYNVSLEEEIERFPKLQLEDIAAIRNWISSQPHLPTISDIQIAHFIHASCYDILVAKRTIEHHFSYKKSVVEFFAEWDTNTNGTIQYARDVMTVAILPKMSPSDSRVLLVSFHNPSAGPYNFALGVKFILMSLQSLLFREGQQKEFRVVFDTAVYSFSHVMKNPISLLKAYSDYCLNCAEIKVVEINVINTSSVIKNMMTIVKPFLGQKCMQMMKFYTSPDGFFKSLPLEVVPSDYGGTGKSLQALREENIKKIEETREALISYSKLGVDQDKKVKKKKKKRSPPGKVDVSELD